MKIWRALVLAAGLSLPGFAAADPIAVRSGDHGSYSRLVMPLPKSGTWSVSHDGDGATLIVTGQKDGFDTATVFDRITNKHIQSISGDAEELNISLNCACDVAAFTADNAYLVIDVADPGQTVVPPVPNGRIAQTRRDSSETTSVSETSHPDNDQISNHVEDRSPILPLVPSGPDLQQRLPPVQSDPLSLPLRSALEMQVLSNTQERLLHNIGQATTRGMLEPEQGGVNAALETIEGQGGSNPPASSSSDRRVPMDAPTIEQAQRGHLRVTSSMDVPLSAGGLNTLSISGEMTCPAPDYLNVAGWSDDDDFATQTSAARQHLFGEFDHLDSTAALTLAKTYLYFGFGVEAQRVLRLSNELREDHPELAELAEIFDYGHVRGQSNLAQWISCDSELALWATLASPDLAPGMPVNTNAALRGLNGLPVHLRTLLAPELSNRLLAQGDGDAASAALRSVKRLPGPLPAESKFADAQLDLASGRTGAGQKQLEEVVASDAEPSATALITLVDSLLRDGQPIPVETATLVEAYSVEMRDSALGPELRRAHMMALIKSGQFDQAFAQLDVYTRENDAVPEVYQNLLKEVAIAAGDIVFLEYIFKQQPDHLADLPAETLLQIVKRLHGTGFSSVAQELIATMPDRPINPARQILEAQIAIELGQPQRAIAALVFAKSEQADLLRAKAKLQAGDHTAARDIYTSLDATSDAENAAWLAEEWAELTASETPLFGPISQLAKQQSQPIVTQEGMLGQTSNALEESSAARATIDALLGDATLQVDRPVE